MSAYYLKISVWCWRDAPEWAQKPWIDGHKPDQNGSYNYPNWVAHVPAHLTNHNAVPWLEAFKPWRHMMGTSGNELRYW